MPNVLFGYSNRADAATLTDGSFNSAQGFGLANLQDPNISLPARTINVTPASTRFRFDLGAFYTTRAAALVHHTLTDSAWWRVRAGLAPFDVDFSQGTGDSRITASSSANGTLFNENGTLVAAGTAGRFDYDRLTCLNGFLSSEDMTTSWAGTAGTIALDSRTVAWNSLVGAQQFNNGTGLNLAVDTYTITGLCRVVSGDGLFGAFIFNGAATINSSIVTATDKWERFTLTIANTTANYQGTGAAGLNRTSTSRTVIQFDQLQICRGAAAVPYRKTTTSRVFACRGMLREVQRTNLALQSAAFDNAAWLKNSTTVLANQGTFLDGTGSMDEVTAVAATAVHYVAQSITVVANSTYTHSVFVKTPGGGSNTVTHVQVAYDQGSSVGGFINVRLSDGAITNGPTSNGGATNVGGGVEPLGDGFYRVWITAQHTLTTGRIIVVLLNTANAAAGMFPSIALTTTDKIRICGGQLELGSNMTSYTPTTTAAVTRTADAIAATGVNFTGWFAQSSGTLYCEHSVRSDSPVNAPNTAVTLSDGTASNHITLRSRTSDDALLGEIIQGGVGTAAGTGQTMVYDGVFARTAISYNSTSAKVAANGAAPTAFAAFTMPTALTQLNIGVLGDGVSSSLDGWVRRVTWWPVPVDDATLTAITAGGPGAFDYDSGWMPALQFGFAQDDVPSDWGKRGYNLMTAFDSRAVRYGAVEIMDPNNAAGTLDLGRLFVCGGFQPDVNATYEGYEDRRISLDTFVESESGKMFGTARYRQKTTAMVFGGVTTDEANTKKELDDFVGSVGEVLFIPDPGDMAASQRDGGLGTLSELSSLTRIFQNRQGAKLNWKEKR